jgi:hypothetical protein
MQGIQFTGEPRLAFSIRWGARKEAVHLGMRIFFVLCSGHRFVGVASWDECQWSCRLSSFNRPLKLASFRLSAVLSGEQYPEEATFGKV